jgi:predicted P-loop ATPase
MSVDTICSDATPSSSPAPNIRVFPLHGIVYNGVTSCACSLGAACKDIGKHPMVRWRSYDENTKGPGGGYGIQTGRFNGIFVVDLDVKSAKNGKPAKDGVAAFTQLAADRPIPDTLSVLTPSGGVHFYFRLPPDLYVPKTLGVLGPGIDILGEGGFVVGPGSPHKNGGVYQEVPGELADAPDWLLQLVVKKPAPPKLVVTEHYVVDPTSPKGVQAIAWTKAYLARAEPAIEGQGGSDRLFAACCHLMYSALPLDVLRQLIEEVYNPRCVPPWSRKEIDHKLTDADRRFEEDRPDKCRGLCSPGFIDMMHARTKETGPRTANLLHDYNWHISMRSDGQARKTSLSEVTADLFEHVDWAGVLQFDTFRDRIIAVDPPTPLDAETSSGISDNDVQIIRLWFEFHGKKIGTQDVRAAIEMVARRQKFNSLQNWLRSLEWDETPRLNRVLPTYFQTADSPYEHAIGRRWFISLIARAMEPGCQSDYTLILEGEQEIGKTSAFRALMHDPIWYAEITCGMEKKDFLENLRGVWLAGFDELDSLDRSSITKVKTTLTRVMDHYRKSYGHYADDFARSCCFCGSTNAEQYLNDMTGGRRFWPVKVLRQIDVSKMVADRDQIFAEAFARWRAGEAWHVDTMELRTLCREEQEARLEIDGWEEIIRRWFADPAKFTTKPAPEEPGSVFKGVRPFDGSKGVTTADVLEHAIGKIRGQWTHGDAIRVGRIFQRLKIKRIQVRTDNGAREWRYTL